MPKTLEEIMAALQALDDGAEFVAGLRSITEDAGKKTKTLRELSNQLKNSETTIKALTDKYGKIAGFVGLQDEVEDLDAALEEIRKKQSTGGKPSAPEIAELTSKINELQRNVKKLTDEKGSFEKAASEERAKRQTMIRDTALRNALEKAEALNPQITSRLLVSNIKVLDDDSQVFIADDGTEVTIDEGVNSFLEKYPMYKVNGQVPGAGSGGGSGKTPDFNNMSMEDYKKYRTTQK